ncbi:hypothetical protein [Mucilaginibacter lappiensis]|uniref:Uncharacterized protein n=1 Tax=Mucilaginibacter lappiensis TaxID=354630 RepID=A0A841JHU7_9SPHI|nr:hypothetical protein [Mucilaginibacter lappiensis]MBB6130743.1 hypothetical protein [Mucilaginibacter lappiensis]
MNQKAWYYHYTAITNSVVEFTFPNLKPGKYYLEGILPSSQTASYNQYTGSSYSNFGTSAYHYERKYYNLSHYDKLDQFVEIKNDGEVLEIKLK